MPPGALKRRPKVIDYTGVNRLRPTRRRLARMAFPDLLELRARNPCWRFNRRFDRCSVRFIKFYCVRFSILLAKEHPCRKPMRFSIERARVTMKKEVSMLKGINIQGHRALKA